MPPLQGKMTASWRVKSFSAHFSDKFLKLNTVYAVVNDSGQSSKQIKARKVKKGVKFTISKYRCIEYNTNEMLCSTTASSLIKDVFMLEKKGTSFSLPDPNNILYHEALGIKRNKYNDVLQLAAKYDPQDCQWFYSTLKSSDNEVPSKSGELSGEDSDN
ncbi:hypothetical protein J6590_041431 [Homalodisca vitripennis]|nr:hypothetical protein J6590_041431 [Homalodisca vitripennis]